MANARYGNGNDTWRVAGHLAGSNEADQDQKPGLSSASTVVARQLIDARGSIDSRTFDEEQRISSVVKDGRDRRDPIVDMNLAQTHWRSRAGQGFAIASGNRTRYDSSPRKKPSGPRNSYQTRNRIPNTSLSGRRDLWRSERRFSTVPLFFKVTIPIIVILAVIAVGLALS